MMRQHYVINAAGVLLWAALAVAQPAASQPTTQASPLAPQLLTVLKYVPDDSHLVIIVPNLGQAVAAINAFGKAIDVKDMATVTALEILEEPLGERARAIDQAGPFVAAFSAQHEEPVLLSRGGAADNLTGTSKPAERVAGAPVYDLGDGGSLALTEDHVVVLGREKADVRRALQSTGQVARRLEERYAKLLANHQMVVYVDVPPWQELVHDKLEMVAQSMYLGMAAAANAAQGIQVWKWIFEEVERFVGELQTYVLAVRVDGNGAIVEDWLDFKADGVVARYLGAVRKPQRDMLRGIPADQAGLVFAFEWELSPDVESIETSMARSVLRTDVLKDVMGADKLETALKRSVDIQRRITGTVGALEAAPEGAGLTFYGLYFTPEGPAVQRDMREMYETNPEIMNAWGGLPSTTVRHEQEKVDGAEADVYEFSCDAAQSQASSVFQMVYGGVPTMFSVLHPQGVIFTLGPRKAMHERVQRLLDPNAPALARDPRVQALFAQLSPHPQFCALADAPRLVKMFSDMLRRMGMPFPALSAGEDAAPLIGFGLYLEPQQVHSELYVPSAPLKAIIHGFEKAVEETGE
jgi:hypothetical protein